MSEGEECFLGEHGFEYDIFFSYAHAHLKDIEVSDIKRWSLQFKRALIGRVGARIPALSVFSDDNAKGGDGTISLSQDLRDKVAASALFHIVMTDQYLDSALCRNELDTFVEGLSPAPTRTQGRIFIANAMNTADRQWPDALYTGEEKLDGWRFYRTEDNLPWGFQKQWADNLPDEIEPELRRLSNAIVKALNDLKEGIARDKRYHALLRGEARSIYLFGRPEDGEIWKIACRAIKKLGIDVWPRTPEEFVVDEGRKAREEHCRKASRCDAMLMVASDPEALEEDLEVMGRYRRQLIWSVHKKYLPCAILDWHGKLETPALRDLAGCDIDWLGMAPSDWADGFKAWLRRSAETVREREGQPSVGPAEEPL